MGRRGHEHHIGAEVIAAALAELTLAAGDAGLQSHAVAHLQVLDVLANGVNHAAALVTQDKGQRVGENLEGLTLEKVHIRAADADVFYFHADLVGADLRHVDVLQFELPDIGHDHCLILQWIHLLKTDDIYNV